jgi:hypothetical protein
MGQRACLLCDASVAGPHPLGLAGRTVPTNNEGIDEPRRCCPAAEPMTNWTEGNFGADRLE